MTGMNLNVSYMTLDYPTEYVYTPHYVDTTADDRILCEYCKTEPRDEDRRCKYCGAPLPYRKQQSNLFKCSTPQVESIWTGTDTVSKSWDKLVTYQYK